MVVVILEGDVGAKPSSRHAYKFTQGAQQGISTLSRAIFCYYHPQKFWSFTKTGWSINLVFKRTYSGKTNLSLSLSFTHSNWLYDCQKWKNASVTRKWHNHISQTYITTRKIQRTIPARWQQDHNEIKQSALFSKQDYCKTKSTTNSYTYSHN